MIEHIAGTTYTVTLQSRNSLGESHAADNDNYSITFDCVVLDECGSESFNPTATHQGIGLYEATLDPTVSGEY